MEETRKIYTQVTKKKVPNRYKNDINWLRETIVERVGYWKCYMNKYKNSNKNYFSIWNEDKDYLIFCYNNNRIVNPTIKLFVELKKKWTEEHIANKRKKEKEEAERIKREKKNLFLDEIRNGYKNLKRYKILKEIRSAFPFTPLNIEKGKIINNMIDIKKDILKHACDDYWRTIGRGRLYYSMSKKFDSSFLVTNKSILYAYGYTIAQLKNYEKDYIDIKNKYDEMHRNDSDSDFEWYGGGMWMRGNNSGY